MQETTNTPHALVRTVRNLHCPKCGALSAEDLDRYNYRFEKEDIEFITFKPSCKHCDAGHSVKLYRDGSIHHEHVKPVGLYGLMLVKRPGEELYLVVEQLFYYHGKEEPSYDQSYWINSGTCPTNWLEGVLLISEQGDTDPHGVFEFVRAISYADIERYHGIDRSQLKRLSSNLEQLLVEIFPEITDGLPVTIHGEIITLIEGTAE